MTAIDYDDYIATHAAGGWDAVLAKWPHYPYADTPTPGLAALLAAHKSVRECPHREPPACGCPSVKSRCSRPDIAGDKSLQECLQCVAKLGDTSS